MLKVIVGDSSNLTAHLEHFLQLSIILLNQQIKFCGEILKQSLDLLFDTHFI